MPQSPRVIRTTVAELALFASLMIGCGSDGSTIASSAAMDAAAGTTPVAMGDDAGVEAATPHAVCGDRRIDTGETCDDGNVVAGDGCNALCMLEPGWACPEAVLGCSAAACGDGVAVGREECDFAVPTLGCTDCKIDVGYDCNGSDCVATVCGNGSVERGEQCDDANSVPFDGCYKCVRDPHCTDGTCDAVCGDGQRFEGENCDDGNTRDGDGCSSTCQSEVGFACEDRRDEPPPSVALPVVYRDFIGEGNSARSNCFNPITGSASQGQPLACFHIDFNGLGGTGVAGIVDDHIGANDRPAYSCPGGDCAQNPGHLFRSSGSTRPNTNGPGPFSEWYSNSPGDNIAVSDELSLPRQPDGTYVFDATNQFYPLDGRGWVAAGDELLASDACPHNLSFTTETHFWFEYRGGEHFTFDGDDDMWVFVNGILVIDLGGLHGSLSASFTLDADTDAALDANGPDTADGSANVVNALRPFNRLPLGMRVGGVYEVAMFQAERNECGSNFKITLTDFNRPRSVCRDTCGDGVVQSDAGEECDDGNRDNGDGCDGQCMSETLR